MGRRQHAAAAPVASAQSRPGAVAAQLAGAPRPRGCQPRGARLCYLTAAAMLFNTAWAIVGLPVNCTPGSIYTVAGGFAGTFRRDGGPATAAAMRAPNGMAIDRLGQVYVAGTGNGRLRKLFDD